MHKSRGLCALPVEKAVERVDLVSAPERLVSLISRQVFFV
jgi:hypothetical protein